MTWMTEWTSITSPSVYSFAGSTLAVIDIPLNDVFSIYIFLSLSLLFLSLTEEEGKPNPTPLRKTKSSFIISTFVQSCSFTHSINQCKCAISIYCNKTKQNKKKATNYTRIWFNHFVIAVISFHFNLSFVFTIVSKHNASQWKSSYFNHFFW